MGSCPWQLQVGWNPLFPSERNATEKTSNETSIHSGDEEDWISSQATKKLDAHRQRKIETLYKKSILTELNATSGPKLSFVPGQPVWVRCADPKTSEEDLISNGNPAKPAQRRWVPGVIVEKLGSSGMSFTYKVNCKAEGESDGSRRRMVIATADQLKKRVQFPQEVVAAMPRSESRKEETRRSYRDVVGAGLRT